MGAVLRALVRKRVLDKGLRDGSSLWLVVGAFGLLRRLYRRSAAKHETVRLREQLRPGDDLVIHYPGKPDRRVRKEIKLVKARRQAAAAAYETERAALAERAAGDGRRARKASRALATLREPRV
jgi:hypothetical protein